MAAPMEGLGPYARLANTHSPSTIKQESITSDEGDAEHEDDDSYHLPAPSRTRNRHGYARGRRHKHTDSASTTSFLMHDDVDAEEQDWPVNNATKLKGTLWPGMDIFDSATPDMRRKRNQKKNAKVLIALQNNSELITPIEWVFDVNGVLQKEREITGIPESDDLIEGESEPEPDAQEKKRARRRPRPALIKKEPNTGRTTRNSRPPPRASTSRNGRGK
jgi:hypothetical protein